MPFYMSTDCEGILRRFLVLNPAKRCSLEVRRGLYSSMIILCIYTVYIQYNCSVCQCFSLFLSPHQQIMKDKWINIGYDGEELKPHTEPLEDLNDTNRIGEKDTPITSTSQGELMPSYMNVL